MAFRMDQGNANQVHIDEDGCRNIHEGRNRLRSSQEMITEDYSRLAMKEIERGVVSNAHSSFDR